MSEQIEHRRRALKAAAREAVIELRIFEETTPPPVNGSPETRYLEELARLKTGHKIAEQNLQRFIEDSHVSV